MQHRATEQHCAQCHTIGRLPRLESRRAEGEDQDSYLSYLLGRLQRELLQRGGDARLEALLARTLAFPDLPPSWKHADLAQAPPPSQRVRLTRGEHSVGFLVAVTAFAAPCQVTLEELRVEACFPLDADTTRTCERLAQNGRL